MDKLSELNELIEDMEAVADKYYRKMKEESSDYLEVKEKYERTARAVAYRDSSEMGRFLQKRWTKDYEKDLAQDTPHLQMSVMQTEDPCSKRKRQD